MEDDFPVLHVEGLDTAHQPLRGRRPLRARAVTTLS